MYNTHIDELADLLKIRDTYSDAYIDEIIRFFPKNKLSFKEVFRLLFGTEYDSKNFHKRPLSKFKKDILGDLGILKWKEIISAVSGVHQSGASFKQWRGMCMTCAFHVPCIQNEQQV